MASEWFYTRDGKSKSGPVSSAQLQALAKSGKLQPADKVWKEGMAKWVPASTIKGLFPAASPTAKTPPSMPALPGETDDGEQLAKESLVTKSVQFVLGQSKSVLAAGACLFTFFAICGFCGISGMMSDRRAAREAAESNRRFDEERKQAEQQAKQDIAEATRLWDAGNKSGAMTKYKAAIQRGTHSIPSGEQPTVFQRVIEYEFAQGNTSAAKGFVEKAAEDRVPLSFGDPKLQEFVVQTEKAYREQQAFDSARLAVLAKKPGAGTALARLQAEKDFAEANRLWGTGDKATAVTKYHAIVKSSIGFVGNGERPTVYQRLIEFEAGQGNTSSARGLIEDALGKNISLSLVEPKAKEIAAQVQKEFQERQAVALAEKKRQDELALAERKRQEELALAQKKDKTEEKIAGEKTTKVPAVSKGINRANYERIQEGMTRQEVEALLGPGKEVLNAGNVRTYSWEAGIIRRVIISIVFQDDRVMAKAIFD